MTQFWRVQAMLSNDSDEPRDNAVNTWHFTSDEVGPDDNTDFVGIVDHLFNNFYTPLDEYLSSNIQGIVDFKGYKLLDPPERVPFDATRGTLTPGTSSYPNELAVVLSYRAAYESGIRKARRRGRIYFGPLASSVGQDEDGDVRLTDAARAAMGGVVDALSGPQAITGGSTIEWCVYSPTTYEEEAPVGVENSVVGLTLSFFPVIGGKVDDAFDIQRRRGRIAEDTFFWGAGW